MTKEQLRQFITGHMAHKLNPELISWINSEKFEHDLEKMIEEDLNQSFAKPALSDKDLLIIADKILEHSKDLPATSDISKPKQKARQIHIPSLLRIAAVILFFAAVIFVYNHYIQDQPATEKSIQLVSKENTRGRKSTIFLNDGTVVHLNSESRISYPEQFADSVREVSLEGEAFFEVATNEKQPFVIKTGDLHLSVLGTSFNVAAFNNTEIIKISMSTGKIAVGRQSNIAPAEVIHLEAGESIIYSKSKKTFSPVTSFDSDLDFGWKDGNMVFRNAGMDEIFNSCERWYDVKFEFKNKPDFNWNYTGEFRNQTLKDVLESLSFSQNFSFNINKNIVTVTFQKL